tara:strand:+ start:167 stop:994 length:828 start_codon:yes stop_codon:yes gene_type:complete
MSQTIIDELPKNEIYNDGTSGLKLSYRYLKNKNKKTIVFLHGYNGNSKSWAYQFKFFKHNYSLISFDFPGFGKSDDMKDPDMFKVSDLIIRALENLKIREYYIVGHSMGGMLAQILSINNNASIIKMVLSCTHKGYSMKYKKPLREPYNKRLQERHKLSDLEYGKLRISKMLPGLQDKEIFDFLCLISRETSSEAIVCGGSSMQILDTTDVLPKIKIPCLILTGSEDIVVSKEKSLFLYNSIKNALHTEIKGVGHAPYCENAMEFNEKINSFLLT